MILVEPPESNRAPERDLVTNLTAFDSLYLAVMTIKSCKRTWV